MLLSVQALAQTGGQPPGGGSLEAQVTALEEEVSLLTGRVSALEAAVATLQTQVADLQIGVAANTVSFDTEVVARQAADDALQAQIATLQSQIAALQSDPVFGFADFLAALDTHFDVGPDIDINGDGVIDPATEALPTVLVTGANLQVVNGLGTTGTTNALGNLVVGYNEPRSLGDPVCTDGRFRTQADCEANGFIWTVNPKTGSHNIVGGLGNAYSQFGGIVLGEGNAIIAAKTSIIGGSTNVASGAGSSIGGGT